MPTACQHVVIVTALCRALALGLPAAAGEAAESIHVRPRGIERIDPGTVIGEHHQGSWNRLVLWAKPRLAAGAVDQVPRAVRDYATRFQVVVMARVTEHEDQTDRRYRLRGVGLGYCTRINGRDVVISSDSQQRLNANLDFIEKIVLGRNEKCLDDARVIASSDTLVIFDVPAIVLRDQAHRDMVVRHLVWVSSPSGKVASLVWLLEGDADRGYRLAEETLHTIAENHVEDRAIHVLASEFTLGVPGGRAFALVRMPQGKAIAATPELARLAASPTFTVESLRAFIRELARAF